jgi:ankyrin repeat protein
MLETDININVRGDIGNTALHEATQKKHEKIVLALLEAGADPNLENDYGDFAIDYLSETDTHLKEILLSAMNP